MNKKYLTYGESKNDKGQRAGNCIYYSYDFVQKRTCTLNNEYHKCVIICGKECPNYSPGEPYVK